MQPKRLDERNVGRHDFSQNAWTQVYNWNDDDIFQMLNGDIDVSGLQTPILENWPSSTVKSLDDLSSRDGIWHTSDITQFQPQAMNLGPVKPANCRSTARRATAGLASNIDTGKAQHWNMPVTRPSPIETLPSSSTTTVSTDSKDSYNPQRRATLMQRLMQAGVAMYEIQNTYSSARSIPSETFPSELAGKVLNVAMEFLKTLLSFSDADSYTSTWIQPSSSLSSDSSTTRRTSITDKHTILQLIANYLLLLQLYLLLHQTIHEHVRQHEPDSCRLQPVWDDLSLGSTPLFQFPEFQIKMILQLAARLLEEIEVALGLAEGCRVSKKSENENGGILGINVTAQFIEMCTSEIATVTEPSGRGDVIRLQELMESLASALNGPIWV